MVARLTDAAEHVLNLGHRNPGVVSTLQALDAKDGLASKEGREAATSRFGGDRLGGCAAATTAAGLPWEDVPVYESSGNEPEEDKKAAGVAGAGSPHDGHTRHE